MTTIKNVLRATLVLAGMGLLAANVAAEPTNITVRVLAKDAKFIGTGMGGAMVEIRNADTGEVLASGLTRGGTGDTGLIMNTPHSRWQSIGVEGAASFSAVLDISDPVRVQISAEGPVSAPESANRVSLTQWVLPGKHLDAGDGIVLTMPGFVLETLAPLADTEFPVGRKVNVKVKMVMMCGCPIMPGGLWDADYIEVSARLSLDGQVLGDWPMAFTGEISEFQADIPADSAGQYEVVVTAYDSHSGNTGLQRISYRVGSD
jgi:hypothetical protein